MERGSEKKNSTIQINGISVELTPLRRKTLEHLSTKGARLTLLDLNNLRKKPAQLSAVLTSTNKFVSDLNAKVGKTVIDIGGESDPKNNRRKITFYTLGEGIEIEF